MTPSGWEGYERLVMSKLNELGGDIQRVEDKVETLLIDVAMLKVKAGVWGAVAGLIPASVAVVFMLTGQ